MKFNIKVILFFLLIFILCVYIFIKSGNNKNENDDNKIIEKILNMKMYSAKINVKVFSNKNENSYFLEEYEDIEDKTGYIKADDFEFRRDKNKLNIINEKFGINKTIEFQNYENNNLFLSTFLKEVDLNKIKNTEKEIVLYTNEKENEYLHIKELHISRNTMLPQKLVCIDEEQKEKVIIEYKEIQINE